jgi:hypothetical protein
MGMASDQAFTYPSVDGLKLADFGSAGSVPCSELNISRFRDAYWLSHLGCTVFNFRGADDKEAKVAYLMGRCRRESGLCDWLANKDQPLPSPETRRDWSCGCAVVCIEFPSVEDMDFASEDDYAAALQMLVDSKMHEAVERLRGDPDV